MEEMRQACEQLKLEYGPGSRLHALRDFFERLTHSGDLKARWEHAHNLLRRPPQHRLRRPLLGRPPARPRHPLPARGVHEARQAFDGAVGVVMRGYRISLFPSRESGGILSRGHKPTESEGPHFQAA